MRGELKVGQLWRSNMRHETMHLIIRADEFTVTSYYKSLDVNWINASFGTISFANDSSFLELISEKR